METPIHKQTDQNKGFQSQDGRRGGRRERKTWNSSEPTMNESCSCV